MSMDDVVGALQIFSEDMDEFTGMMANAATDLGREHDALAPIWSDSFSQKYRQDWSTFDGELDGYLNGDANRYRDFLDDRVVLLRRYLNG